MPSIADYGTKRTTLNSLTVGDYIECEYTATTPSAGTFANLGAATKSEIPVAGAASPNGKFNFICVERKAGKGGLCIADRPIQHSISWDTLNAAGLIEGNSGVASNIGNPAVGYVTTHNVSSGAYTCCKTVTPSANMIVYGLQAKSHLTTSVAKAVIYRVSDQVKIAESSSVTMSSTSTKYTFNFTAPITLAAGVEYRVGLQGTNLPYILGSGTQGVYTLNFPNNTVSVSNTFFQSGDVYPTGSNSTASMMVFDLITGNYLIRSISGGNTYVTSTGLPATTDQGYGAYPTNNEFDSFIRNSTLGGKITAGDNNVWNWNQAIRNWTRETPILSIGANTLRTMRGYTSALATPNFSITSNVTPTSIHGFRPVLEFSEGGQIFW